MPLPLRHIFLASVKIVPLLLVSAGAAAMLSLGSCSTTSAPAYSDDDSPAEGQLFGDYLAGVYANYVDDAPARSRHFTRAFEAEPSNKGLGRRAVTSALTADDFDLTVKLAGRLESLAGQEPMANAVLGAQHMAAGRYTKALSSFDLETTDLTMSILMQLMKGWSQHANGDDVAARKTFAALSGGSYFTRFGLLQLAELETNLGNYAAAETALTELEASGPKTLELEMVLLKARMLSAKGDLTAAEKYLTDYSKEHGSFETGPITAAIGQLKTGAVLDSKFTPQQYAARALTQPAYGFFAQNRALDAGEVFLRIAVKLDPDYDKARMWMGDVLAAYKRDDEALALYQSVPDSSPYYVSAKLSEGNLHVRRDNKKKGLALFQALNNKQPSFITRDALGRAYLSEENYQDALPIYEALVANLSEEELKQDPQVLYLRGICYERVKNFPAAVADFQRVLSYTPDDADTLNYLGYTWVDRGENLTKAFAMIHKAVELEPQSGAIIDSLGWAHYKLGEYEKAKVKLEEAVRLAPSSATIIDHLGDVYYKLGRKREAGYQWHRALDYDPTDKERKDIASKIKGGLYAVKAAP